MFIFLMIICVTQICAQQADDKKKEINKIKKSSLYLSAEMALPIVRFNSNNRKFALRNAKYGDLYPYEDGEFEKYHPEMIVDPFEDELKRSALHELIDSLPPAQKERIMRHFFDGESFVDIAAAEGVSPQAVQQSISRSLTTLKKLLKGVDN